MLYMMRLHSFIIRCVCSYTFAHELVTEKRGKNTQFFFTEIRTDGDHLAFYI
jgi:hypothetical protein